MASVNTCLAILEITKVYHYIAVVASISADADVNNAVNCKFPFYVVIRFAIELDKQVTFTLTLGQLLVIEVACTVLMKFQFAMDGTECNLFLLSFFYYY